MTTKHIKALLLTTAALGFEWKKDGDVLALDGDGNPIWITGDKELSVKGDTISSLQGEARRNRLRAEAAEGKVAAFEGIDDPEAAKQALQTVKNIKDGELVAAGKVEEVRAEITKQLETRISTAEQKAADANARADKTLLDSAFNGSEFARNSLTDAGLDLARSMFGNRFKVEDGKIVATNERGETIYSDKDMGNAASFDEALEKIVGGYKHKDSILKAPDANGTGSGGGGGNRGQGRTMTRAQFEALSPSQQAEAAGKFGSGEMTLTD